ncbi:hypothetical protein QUA45_17455 [Microcoleus sp. Pol12A5]
MCTAPEGKSIFAWKTLKPELLLRNEVIGKRIGMPISNLKPCQIKPSLATNVDSIQKYLPRKYHQLLF